MKVISFPPQAAAPVTAEAVEEHLCEMRSLTLALEATVSGERYTTTRDFLVHELQARLDSLEQILLPAR